MTKYFDTIDAAIADLKAHGFRYTPRFAMWANDHCKAQIVNSRPHGYTVAVYYFRA